ncbi:MAG: hypothetical protein M1839_001692 [Geoglossum umbratile]|nr:MAG: hypothetical protein M1839_001692 [Geoglossum umbratile]
MTSLSNEHKATISKNPIGQELSLFPKLHSDFVSKFSPSPSCNDIASSAITGSGSFKGAGRLVGKLLSALQALDAAEELPPHRGSPRESLFKDMALLCARFPKKVSAEAIANLLEHAIAKPVNEESLWSAVYDLFRPVTQPPQSETISPSSHTPFLHDLYSDWNGEFFEDPLIGLRQQMKDCISGPLPYYAKTLVFVQSSGMGKSRLADNFGTTCPMINFILRKEGVGYPPTDSEIQKFMCKQMPEDLLNAVQSSPPKEEQSTCTYPPSRAAIIWNYSVMFGILKASFKIFNVWVKGQTCTEMCLEKLANIRYEEMKLSDTNGTGDTSSQKRIDFCHQVKRKASEIARSLVMDREWRKLFNVEGESAVRQAMGGSKQVKKLLRVVERLTNNLKKFPRKNQSDDHLLVIVFDEAASLFSPSGLSRLDSGRYIALNRICSLLKDYPLWFFFLSTESKVEKILPADNPIPSNEGEVLDYSNVPSSRFPSRGNEIKLRVFPAFVSFPLDIEDRSRMRKPDSKKDELAKSMLDFSRPQHMAMFGRRLWYAYSNPQDMYNVARLKLVGGREGATYDYDNENHVFAALSFRLSLDPCLENSMSLPLVTTAVGSFMRVVISINQPTGNLHTVTPSEPILAKAAMEHLCRPGRWSGSVDILSRELLQKGLIEKGLKGELFARLVLILAHDSIRRRAAIPGNPEQIDLERMPTFTVEEFLRALYAEDHHKSISNIDKPIRQAKMNFTHFTSTRANLPTGSAIINLCHDLLRRSAAMQLSPNNPAFDQLIPIYLGTDEETVDPKKCGVILIQNKNRVKATTPNHIFDEVFTQPQMRQSSRKPDTKSSIHQSTEYASDDPPPTHQTITKSSKKLPIRQSSEYAFKEMRHPILFLLFDLNVNPGTAARVRVTQSTDNNLPRVWAIHSRGHTDEVFGCLRAMDVSNETNAFFASAVVEEKGMYGDIARRNLVFDKLERGFRYAEIKTDRSGYKEVSDDDDGQDVDNDRDIQMEDA